jgi:phosphatidate cytidylyltransferase
LRISSVAGEQLALPSAPRAAPVPPAALPDTAVRPASGRSGVLLRRVVAGFLIAPPILLGVYAGGAWFVFGTALITFLALREFYALSARPGRRLLQPLGFLLAFVILLANGGADLIVDSLPALPNVPGKLFLDVWLRPDRVANLVRFSVAAAVIVPLVALLFERADLKGRLVGWALTLAGTLYVAWLMSFYETLRVVGPPGLDAGRGWVFLTLAVTWSFDSGAYFVGSRFGRHRFMEWISPNKTWEGVAGGVVSCTLAVLAARTDLAALSPALADWLGWAPLPIPLWQVPLLAAALAAAAQFGDLAESMIKREAGAKDASELIPGHGGMLDRIDSLLFTVVLVYYYAVVVTLP